jgi:hypothetical protein
MLADELVSLVSYSLHMLKRRTILLLAAVMALGAAFFVPSVSMGRGAEVCAIVCLAERQCERREIGAGACGQGEVTAGPVCFHSQAPRVEGFIWPASYQRPPTSSLI